MGDVRTKVAGMDLGDKYSQVWVGDGDGKCIERAKVRTTPERMGAFFKGQEPMLVVIEVGTHSAWVSRLLTEAGHEVIVANARQVRLIHGSHSKNDKLDAERLARLARVDPGLLHPIRHRSAGEQQDLALVRSRGALVEARTQLVNHVRGTVKALGLRLRKCSTESFCKRATTDLPAEVVELLAPVLRSIAELCAGIARYERTVDRASKKYAEVKQFQGISGVGPITAMSFRLVVQSPGRFPDTRSIGSYLGLRPKQDQSGTIDRQLRITKAGDKQVRKLLVNSAHYILGPHGEDCDLRRWGLKLMARGGKNAKKRAAVSVARKLAVLLLAIWKSGQPYVPLRGRPLQAQAAAA